MPSSPTDHPGLPMGLTLDPAYNYKKGIWALAKDYQSILYVSRHAVFGFSYYFSPLCASVLSRIKVWAATAVSPPFYRSVLAAIVILLMIIKSFALVMCT